MDGPKLPNHGSLALLLLWFRRFNGGLGFALIVLVACTVQTTPTTASSTPTATTRATSATDAPSTSTSTTVAVDSPVDICVPGISTWEIDETYVAPCFLTPLQFTPIDEGWSSIRADLEWVEGMWTEPGERDPAMRFVILAYEPQSTPDEVIASILAIESVDPLTEPAADGDQLSVDVTTGPDRVADPLSGRECMITFSRALNLINVGGALGTVLVEGLDVGGGYAYGMGACWTFRIWATTVADTTITVIATTADLDRFDELMPTAERLVTAIELAAG